MSLTTQFYTMLTMIGMGSWIGLSLDTYGRFLKRPFRARWIVFINDFMFWILQGLILFYLLLRVNEGELRVYIFLALLCGYAAYQSLFKSTYLKILERLIQTSLHIYRIMKRLSQVVVISPIIGLFKFTVTILIGFLNAILSLLKWAWRLFYILIKILFAPVNWIFVMIWKMIPQPIRNFIVKYAGISKKTKNITNYIKGWWERKNK